MKIRMYQVDAGHWITSVDWSYPVYWECWWSTRLVSVLRVIARGVEEWSSKG
jgi:hypothetical protein